MIISCYPTVGKSTLSMKNNLIIDLDSKPFNSIKSKFSDWWKIYCDIALDLEKQGYIVLIWANNENIHRYLKNNAESYHIIIYDENLKEYVYKKAKARDKINPKLKTTHYILSKFDGVKDQMMNISMEYNIDLYLINDKNYNLEYIINNKLKK